MSSQTDHTSGNVFQSSDAKFSNSVEPGNRGAGGRAQKPHEQREQKSNTGNNRKGAAVLLSLLMGPTNSETKLDKSREYRY